MPTTIPTPEDFVPSIDAALAAIRERLLAAGEAYGESVLFELEEVGPVTLCFTKASRALWSFKQGKPPEHRKDTWLDLAGYAILEIARQAYISNEQPDGMHDRVPGNGG